MQGEEKSQTAGHLIGPNDWILESSDDFDYDFDKEVGTATNGIVIRYGDVVLSARTATFHQLTHEVEARGDVRVTKGDRIWSGETLDYNFDTGHGLGSDFKTGQSPFFIRGETLVAEQKLGVYVLGDGEVTTDDYEKPGYRVRAKELIIVPGQYIEAHHAVLYWGTVPVMYFPRYRRTLTPHPNHWVVTPGIRSRLGPFLLTSYEWYWNERLDGAVHVDGRMKRGIGVGPDFNYHLSHLGDGTIKYYFTKDDASAIDFPGSKNEEHRQRVWFTHSADLSSNLTFKAVVRWQSDALVARDFFESEYRADSQPKSTVELNRQWSNFSLNLLVQPRVNSFQESVERLPDLRLEALRQQIGATPLYYESQSSAGYYRRHFTNDVDSDFRAWRVDTFHQVVLPRTFFDFLNFTPRLGARFTHYDDVTGLSSLPRERDRVVFNTGAELSFKASRVWPGVRSRFFEVNGLRHIFEPSINYVYVPRPNARPSTLPQFDDELPTSRLLPIEFPDYNAIDSVDSQNVFRFGLHNKLQTKRGDGIENLVNWSLYTDWRVHARTNQSSFAGLYSDLDLKPFHWLTFSSETRFDLDRRRWSEANHEATLVPNNRWSFTVGHRYLDDNVVGTNGNNLIYSRLYYRLSENWGARVSHHFEARDGTMEEQLYTIYRDFRSWTTAITLRIREQRFGPTDYTGAITFSFKAHPRFHMGDDVNRPSLLLGY